MINYLCNLGWNDGTDQEIYTVDELVAAFSLNRVTKSPAVFDMKKLRWINGQHLRALPQEKLVALLSEQLTDASLLADGAPEPLVTAIAAMVAEKIELVNDAEPLVRDALSYPLAETLASDPAAAFIADGFADVARAVIAAHTSGDLPDPASEGFEAEWKGWVKGVGKELGRKGKGLFMPLRMVMTGRMAGPDIPAQLGVLGLAPNGVQVDIVSLDERMAILKAELEKLPEPATVA